MEHPERAKTYLDSYLGLATHEDTAEAVNRVQSTISVQLGRQAPQLHTQAMDKKVELSDKFERWTRLTFDDMDLDRNNGTLSYTDRYRGVLTAKIAADGMQMLRGLPTEYVAQAHLHLHELPAFTERFLRLRAELVAESNPTTTTSTTTILDTRSRTVADGVVDGVEGD